MLSKMEITIDGELSFINPKLKKADQEFETFPNFTKLFLSPYIVLYFM